MRVFGIFIAEERSLFVKLKTNMKSTDTVIKKKILILEDEGDTCFLLNGILQNNNVSIEQVNTIAQAIVFLKEETPDVLIMDNKLPDGRGVNHIQEFKQAYPTLKIIMISGKSDASDKAKAMKYGADRFLAKPFTKEQIQQSLQQLAV